MPPLAFDEVIYASRSSARLMRSTICVSALYSLVGIADGLVADSTGSRQATAPLAVVEQPSR
jgi:hypothetical protein